MDITKLIQKQRQYYRSNMTMDYQFRKQALITLRTAVLKYEGGLKKALYEDLSKNQAESYFAEIGITLKEISYMLKHLKRLMRNRYVRTGLIDFPGKSFRSPHPYGVTLVMSPWNYPVMLTLCPLVGALAAGNTCILKPSDYSANTSKVIQDMIMEFFPEEYVAVVTGGREQNQTLLDQKFDYIFFTGGKYVGRIVMEKASKHLTPISLELGGKSPCIVDQTANLKIAAKRIAFGKFINAGQSCVAPDYVYVHKSVKEEFIQYLKEAIISSFTEKPLQDIHLGKIINQKHFNRLLDLLKNQHIVYGGEYDDTTLKIAPTIIDNITEDNIIMEDEIFGPILPILTYTDIDDVIDYINSQPNPLAFYLFTSKKQYEQKLIAQCNFGGGCINDTVVHVASEHLPFGGVGESGMGNYHGKASFKTFSHYRSILKKDTWFDLPARYAPYSSFKEKLFKRFLK